jgi:hypothetical protein
VNTGHATGGAARQRATYRLAVAALLVLGGVAHGRPAPAAVIPISYTLYALPYETTPAQLTALDVFFQASRPGGRTALPIAVTLDGRTLTTTTTDANWDYTSPDLPVPGGLVTCGTNQVAVVAQVTPPVTLQTATVQAYCPTLAVTPNPVPSGGGPATFTVTGTGYQPDRTVTLNLDGATNSFANEFTDETGRFTATVTRPALACGAHQLVGTGQTPPVIGIVPRNAVGSDDLVPAGTSFAVAGGACTPAPPPGKPAITANPAVLEDGTFTHVTGSGFAAHQAVVLDWQTVGGAVVDACSPNADAPPTLTADAAGKIDTYCYARPNELLGAAQIGAVQGAAKAAAAVVVEGGPMQPSSGGDQLVFRR